MSEGSSWQNIVASSLDWGEAHMPLDVAVNGLENADSGRLADGHPHSVWQLVEHIRIAQRDLLDFCINSDYRNDLRWPKDYWPENPAPADELAWNESLDAIRRDRTALAEFVVSGGVDLASKIPNGTGQTYLRTVLLAVDHAAYHLGQIVDVRRLIGSWPPAK